MKKIHIDMQYITSGMFFLSIKCDDILLDKNEANQPIFPDLSTRFSPVCKIIILNTRKNKALLIRCF